MKDEVRPMYLVELDTAIDLCYTIFASPAQFDLQTKWFAFNCCVKWLEWYDLSFYDDVVARLMSPECVEVSTDFKLFVISSRKPDKSSTG